MPLMNLSGSGALVLVERAGVDELQHLEAVAGDHVGVELAGALLGEDARGQLRAAQAQRLDLDPRMPLA